MFLAFSTLGPGALHDVGQVDQCLEGEEQVLSGGVEVEECVNEGDGLGFEFDELLICLFANFWGRLRALEMLEAGNNVFFVKVLRGVRVHKRNLIN